jgi:hypothetical protein
MGLILVGTIDPTRTPALPNLERKQLWPAVERVTGVLRRYDNLLRSLRSQRW